MNSGNISLEKHANLTMNGLPRVSHHECTEISKHERHDASTWVTYAQKTEAVGAALDLGTRIARDTSGVLSKSSDQIKREYSGSN